MPNRHREILLELLVNHAVVIFDCPDSAQLSCSDMHRRSAGSSIRIPAAQKMLVTRRVIVKCSGIFLADYLTLVMVQIEVTVLTHLIVRLALDRSIKWMARKLQSHSHCNLCSCFQILKEHQTYFQNNCFHKL